MSFKAAFVRAGRLLTGLLTPAQARHETDDWGQTRAPLIDDDRVMQSHTHAWLRAVPNGVHPKQLCRHYPRIANRIAVNWEHLHVVDRLLTDLMVDRRGGRLGFPPRIRQEIERLYGFHAKRMTPLLRGRVVAGAGTWGQRSAVEPPRRVHLGNAVTVSSIKR